jgi:hypothetical protein
MKKVTKDEFFKTIGPQNVHPQIINTEWPYIIEMRTPNGDTKGRVIEDTFNVSEYYLPEVTP